MKQTTFAKELSVLINKEGWDDAVNIPDFILAEFLESVLGAMETAEIDRSIFTASPQTD